MMAERRRVARIYSCRRNYAVGVSPGSIFGWETGRSLPRARSVARLHELRKMGLRGTREAASAGRRAKSRSFITGG